MIRLIIPSLVFLSQMISGFAGSYASHEEELSSITYFKEGKSENLLSYLVEEEETKRTAQLFENKKEITTQDYLYYLSNSWRSPLANVRELEFYKIDLSEICFCSLETLFPALQELRFRFTPYTPTNYTYEALTAFFTSFPKSLRVLKLCGLPPYALPSNLNETCPRLEEVIIARIPPRLTEIQKKVFSDLLTGLPASLKALHVLQASLSTLPDNLAALCPNLEVFSILYNEGLVTRLDDNIISPSIKIIDLTGTKSGPPIRLIKRPIHDLTPEIIGGSCIVPSIYAPNFCVKDLILQGRHFKGMEDFSTKLNIKYGIIAFHGLSPYLISLGIKNGAFYIYPGQNDTVMCERYQTIKIQGFPASCKGP